MTTTKNKSTNKVSAATIDQLSVAALAAWTSHTTIGRSGIKAMRTTGTALSKLAEAVKHANGGFTGWCNANGVSRQTALRYMAFAKDYAAAEGGEYGVEAARLLAEATDVAGARIVLSAAKHRTAAEGDDGREDTLPVTPAKFISMAADIAIDSAVNVGGWVAGLLEVSAAVADAVGSGRVDTSTLATAATTASKLIKMAEVIRREIGKRTVK